MAENKNGDEVKAEHERVLGQATGEFYHALWNDFCSLQFKWQEYEELFAKSPKRIDLLNRAAPSFFAMLEDTLWDDLLLHIARLLDKKIVAGRKNLTFATLPELEPDAEARTELETLVAVALESAKFAVQHRNRRL